MPLRSQVEFVVTTVVRTIVVLAVALTVYHVHHRIILLRYFQQAHSDGVLVTMHSSSLLPTFLEAALPQQMPYWFKTTPDRLTFETTHGLATEFSRMGECMDDYPFRDR